MDIAKGIAKRAADIEQRIQTYLPKVEGYQHTIFEAMDYSVTAGGKRLRPMLMEASYEMFGGTDPKVVEPFMAAIECIHTYSLVHDDLPEMDDDAYRRGKLTTHKQFGQAMGVLAGDALLNYAFEIVAKALVAQAGDAKAAKAFEVLARKAGVYGMIGGQVVDVESEKKNETVERERLDFIYRLKTGALLEASLMVGAILAGADDMQVKKMEEAGTKLGLAFQIQDDILDVTSTVEVLGKPIGSDEKNQKATYVSFEGIDKAKQDVALFSEEAVAILEECSGEHTFLRELFLYLMHREK